MTTLFQTMPVCVADVHAAMNNASRLLFVQMFAPLYICDAASFAGLYRPRYRLHLKSARIPTIIALYARLSPFGYRIYL